MNAALYGFVPRAAQMLMVDCGLTFPGPDLPGVDLVLPDLSSSRKSAAIFGAFDHARA